MAEKSEKEYLKEMQPAQRVAHYWHYYKWFILIGAGIAALVIGIIYTMLRQPAEYVAQVIMVNTDVYEANDTDYFDGFIEQCGYEDGEEVSVDASYDVSLDGEDDASSTNYQILAAMFLSGEIDVFLSDEEIFMLEAVNYAFVDLSDVLPEDLLEKYSDKLVYIEDDDTGERIPYGIRLDESTLYTEETLYAQPPVVGIGSQSEDVETDVNLIRYLLGEPVEPVEYNN